MRSQKITIHTGVFLGQRIRWTRGGHHWHATTPIQGIEGRIHIHREEVPPERRSFEPILFDAYVGRLWASFRGAMASVHVARSTLSLKKDGKQSNAPCAEPSRRVPRATFAARSAALDASVSNRRRQTKPGGAVEVETGNLHHGFVPRVRLVLQRRQNLLRGQRPELRRGRGRACHDPRGGRTHRPEHPGRDLTPQPADGGHRGAAGFAAHGGPEARTD